MFWVRETLREPRDTLGQVLLFIFNSIVFYDVVAICLDKWRGQLVPAPTNWSLDSIFNIDWYIEQTEDSLEKKDPFIIVLNDLKNLPSDIIIVLSIGRCDMDWIYFLYWIFVEFILNLYCTFIQIEPQLWDGVRGFYL